MVMSNLVIILSFLIPLELCSDYVQSQLCLLGGINKDPAVPLDGARQPPKYGNNVSSTNLKIQPTLKFCD